MDSIDVYVKNFVNLVDRISKILSLPTIRMYDTYFNSPYGGLDDLGFKEIEIWTPFQEYLYVSDDDLYPITVGGVSDNSILYRRCLNNLENIDITELLNMTDDEFKLLIRLN